MSHTRTLENFTQTQGKKACWTVVIGVLVVGGAAASVSGQPLVLVRSRAQALGFTWQPDPHQLIVAAVKPSSAAAAGKFQAGDTLLAVNATTVTSPKAFEDKVNDCQSGSTLKVQVTRAGTVLHRWLTLPRLTEKVTKEEVEMVLQGNKHVFTKDGQPYTGWVVFAQSEREGCEAAYIEGMVTEMVWFNAQGKKFQEVEWQDSEPTRQRSFDPNGQAASEVLFRNGQPHEGIAKGFHPNGQLASEKVYQDGQQTKELFYDPAGQLAGTVLFQNGRPFEGGVVSFHPNGQLASEWVWQDGQLTKQVSYDPAGQLAGTVLFQDGQRFDGVVVEFHPNGQKDREVEYRNGRCVRESMWNPDGSKKKVK